MITNIKCIDLQYCEILNSFVLKAFANHNSNHWLKLLVFSYHWLKLLVFSFIRKNIVGGGENTGFQQFYVSQH